MKLLLSDLRAKQVLYGGEGPPASLLKVILADGTLANALYRCQSALARIGLAPLALLPHLINKWLNGCVIGVKAQFGPGFVLIHPVGVVINSSVRGGSNVWLESSVVIGENRGGFPQLGHHIFVGSGAKIIGPVQVGDGARVGANAVVLKNVPPGATAVGVPAQMRPAQAKGAV